MRISALLFLASLAFGAPAAPVNISAATRAANVVTVTCATPCGIVANQGFSINGVTLDTTLNTNGVASAGAGTSFGFAQVGANGSIGAGGTVVPAKQVIVLTTTMSPTGGISISGVFWITTQNGVPTGQGSTWAGASVQENNAIKAGTTIEAPFSYGPTVESKAAIQTDLQGLFLARQLQQNSASVQPGAFFGGFFDGVGWSF